MSLPQWCQTHSLKEFMELMEEVKITNDDWQWAENALHCQAIAPSGGMPSEKKAIYNLGTVVPKKEKKMTHVETNVPSQDLEAVATVVTDEQAAKFLAELGDKLAEDGEVLVQTSEDVGTETVH